MKKKELEDFKIIGVLIESLLHDVSWWKKYSYMESVPDQIKCLDDEIRKMEIKRLSIVNQVKSLEDPLYRMILTHRYFLGKDLNEISRNIAYSYHYTSRLLKAAIKAFEGEDGLIEPQGVI